MNDHPFVEVAWLDHTGSSGWESLETATRDKPVKCVSRGWLIHKSRTHLILASSYIDDEDKTVGGREVIIRSCVTDITELNIK